MEIYACAGRDLTCCAVLVLLLHANVDPEDSLNEVPRVIIWVSSPKMSKELDEPEQLSPLSRPVFLPVGASKSECFSGLHKDLGASQVAQ